MLRLRRTTRILAALTLAAPSLVGAQGRIIDEGTFSVTRAGAAHTENFRIARIESGLIKATGQVVGSAQRISSALTVDSLGTPLRYDVAVTDKGVKTANVRAVGGAGRLTATLNDQRGEESMREYPLAAGQSVLVDDGLVHQLFFVSLGRRPGNVQVIDPRAGRAGSATLSGMGLEPVEIGGKSVTATHYSLVNGAVRREFWVDAAGRLLRVEIPSLQLVAAREELPR
jgi:hypothetical protein